MRCAVCFVLLMIAGAACFAQRSDPHPREASAHGDALKVILSLITQPVMETEHIVRMLEEAEFKQSGYDPYTDSWLWGHQRFGMTKSPDIQHVIESIEEDSEILGQVWFWRLGFRGVSLTLSRDQTMTGLSAVAVSTTYFPDIFHACRKAGFRLDTTVTRETKDYGSGAGRQTEVKFLLSRESDDDDEVWIWMCRDYCLLKYSPSM